MDKKELIKKIDLWEQIFMTHYMSAMYGDYPEDFDYNMDIASKVDAHLKKLKDEYRSKY